MAPGDGGQHVHQLNLRERHQHWQQYLIRNQEDLVRSHSNAATINAARDTILEEILAKIDDLENKQQQLTKELESEKKQGAWKHSQELGRAKRASENLQDENDDLQKEVDRVNKNFSALQDQHDKLQESKQEVMIERGTLHERIMDLEAEVRKVKETNRALQRSAPPSHPRAFRSETSRPAVAARTRRVNENILSKDFRAFDNELKTLVDIPVEISLGDPSLAQLLEGPGLCKWYYLKGVCGKPDCNNDHEHPKLSSGEMDRLLYLGRQGMCPYKVPCMDRRCFFSHPKFAALDSTGLKRVKDEDSPDDKEGRHVRARH